MSIMMKSKVAAAGLAVAVAAAPAAALASSQAQPGTVAPAAATANRQITLKGTAAYPRANGSAQYQAQQGHRELQVEVQRIRALHGSTVVFSAAGVTLGTARVSPSGQADVTRNTERGQKVPAIVSGSRVAVRTATGKLIVAGRF
jgi:hypothetical protein